MVALSEEEEDAALLLLLLEVLPLALHEVSNAGRTTPSPLALPSNRLRKPRRLTRLVANDEDAVCLPSFITYLP